MFRPQIIVSLSLLCHLTCLQAQLIEIQQAEYRGDSYSVFPLYQSKHSTNRLEKHNIRWARERYQLAPDAIQEGAWIQYYDHDSSVAAKIFHLQGGEIHGKMIKFHPNGNRESETNYEQGRLSGSYQRWYENGKLWRQGTYVLDKTTYSSKKAGKEIHWYKNGLVEHEAFYQPPGLRSGIWKSYHPNGHLKQVAKYVNHKLDSIYKEYSAQGQTLVSYYYLEGKMIDSLSHAYHINGQVKSQGKSVNGTPVEEWTYFYPNGQTKRQGSYQSYHTTICVSAAPRQGLLSVEQGVWIYYYPDGKLMAKGAFRPVQHQHPRGLVYWPVEIGEWHYYYPSGQLMAQGAFELHPEPSPRRRRAVFEANDPQKTGKWQYFDQKGTLMKSRKGKRSVWAQVESMQRGVRSEE